MFGLESFGQIALSFLPDFKLFLECLGFHKLNYFVKIPVLFLQALNLVRNLFAQICSRNLRESYVLDLQSFLFQEEIVMLFLLLIEESFGRSNDAPDRLGVVHEHVDSTGIFGHHLSNYLV